MTCSWHHNYRDISYHILLPDIVCWNQCRGVVWGGLPWMMLSCSLGSTSMILETGRVSIMMAWVRPLQYTEIATQSVTSKSMTDPRAQSHLQTMVDYLLKLLQEEAKREASGYNISEIVRNRRLWGVLVMQGIRSSHVCSQWICFKVCIHWMQLHVLYYAWIPSPCRQLVSCLNTLLHLEGPWIRCAFGDDPIN